MAILRLLTTNGEPLGVNAIAKNLGMAPSTCFRILKVLQSEDLVQIDENSKEYGLGSGAISIGVRALDPLRSFSIVRPRLQALADKYSLAVGLWHLLTASNMTLTGFAENNDTMRIHMSNGQRLPALIGAIGQVVAARLNLPDGELRIRYSNLRWQAPLSFDEYRAQVQLAAQIGYGHDVGNLVAGVESIGVAIADGDGATRYGISGSMFIGQHTAETVAMICRELKEIGTWAGIRLATQPLN